MKLPPGAYRRDDETPDAEFYREPRLVTHIDDGAIAAVTQLYREHFPPGGAVLDLMSSWISHLPPEAHYQRVAGLGMNAVELSANPQLTEWIVHDLNHDPQLPFRAGEFDGAAICVSVDYLVRPVDVLRDAARVLRPGAPLVITFSNRCFPTKAIAAWLHLDDGGHAALVTHWLREAGVWEAITSYDRSPPRGDPLYAVVGRTRVNPSSQTSAPSGRGNTGNRPG